MRILHILRRQSERMAEAAIARHCQDQEVTVVLIQDAVGIGHRFPCPVFALKDDAEKMHVKEDLPRIDYASLVRLLFDHDRVICW